MPEDTVEERLRRTEAFLALIADVTGLAVTSPDESISADGFAALSGLARQAVQDLHTTRRVLPMSALNLTNRRGRL